MDISLNIIELLFINDCVIIPGFGGFITNYLDAQISDKNIFSPPCKVVAFNRNLKSDDGLLINSIVNKEGLSYTEAKIKIHEFVSEVNTKLGLSKEYTFEGIGNFKIDNNKILQFEPLVSANFLIDSYGLSTFYFPKIKNISEVRKINRTFKDRDSIKPSLKPLPVKKILIGTFLLFVFALIPNNRNLVRNLKINTSSFYSTYKSCESIKSIPKKNDISIIPEETNDGKIPDRIPVNEKEVNSIDSASETEHHIANEDLDYHVIAGCFKNKENAENYKNSLIEQGLSPSILKYSKGLYKVSVGSYSSEKAAVQQIHVLNKSFPGISVWLFKK